MEKKDSAYFKKLARNLMFDLTEEEAQDIVKEFETLTRQLELLEAIDTTGVEEMIYPFEGETSYLRDDHVNHVISHQEAICNASKVKQGHFVVPKELK